MGTKTAGNTDRKTPGPERHEERKRILFVITRAERGGAQAHVLELLRSVASRYEVALAIGEPGFLVDEALALGIPVYRAPHMAVPLNPVRDAEALLELLRIVRGFRPHLIHAHSSKAGILARIAACMQHVPCVFTAHGWAFSRGVPPGKRFVAYLCELLAGFLPGTIIAVSRYDRDLAQRYHVGRRRHRVVIKNGIRDNPLRADPHCSPPIVTMVARFSQQKDHETLLCAASRIKTPFRLWLVGDGPLLGRARIRALDLGLGGRVEFLGGRSEVPEILAKSQIFALISRYEGLPISILEAMRAGLPVIATDTGGVAETVKTGWNGFLIEDRAVGALRQVLELLISDPRLRQTLGKNSRALFEACFSADTMIDRVVAVYERTMELPLNRV